MYQQNISRQIENSNNANKRLFLGGIPDNKTKHEIWNELMKIGMKNITDVIMYRSYNDPNKNRGFVFLEFNSIADAYKTKMEFRSSILFGEKVFLDWSSPLHTVSEVEMKKVKKLFLRNLNILLTRDDLSRTLSSVLKNIFIQKVYKFRDYSFVHFKTRSDAENALIILKSHFQNTNVEVCWAIPPPAKKEK